jgi:hypothetical protein
MRAGAAPVPAPAPPRRRLPDLPDGDGDALAAALAWHASGNAAAWAVPSIVRLSGLSEGWVRPLLTLLPSHWLWNCAGGAPCRNGSAARRPLRLRVDADGTTLVVDDEPSPMRFVFVTECDHPVCLALSGWADRQLAHRWLAWYRAAHRLLLGGSGGADGPLPPPPSLAEVDAYLVPPFAAGNVQHHAPVTHLSAALRVWHAHRLTSSSAITPP